MISSKIFGFDPDWIYEGWTDNEGFLCVFFRIIERTIRAAVEHHFFELKTSIDQDLSNYDSKG